METKNLRIPNKIIRGKIIRLDEKFQISKIRQKKMGSSVKENGKYKEFQEQNIQKILDTTKRLNFQTL